jgi:hypothetical protein
MKTATIFNYLSAQNLLVPFIKENKVLQDLEKEDLLLLVEKLLDPPVIEKTMDEQIMDAVSSITFQPTHEEKPKFAVDTDYRQNTIKYNVQDVLNNLVKDGVVPRGSFSKSEINNVAYDLYLITFKYCGNGRQKQWMPTPEGQKCGITQRTFTSVYYSLEAYEIIKNHLLNNRSK